MGQGQNNYNAAVVGERADELGLGGLEIVRAVRKRRKTGYAIAIFGATVRSLSSFALFFSNACCLQLAKLRQLWCSGIRCCGRGEIRISGGTRIGREKSTHCAAEFCTTMRALADYTKGCRVAANVGLELATLLGWHCGCGVCRVRVELLCESTGSRVSVDRSRLRMGRTYKVW